MLTLTEDVEKREEFYELVNSFVKQFSTCMMLHDFTDKIDEDKLRRYQKDLQRFVELKKIQKEKEADSVDFSKYENQIRRILDKYVEADYVQQLSKPLLIQESGEFNEYIENLKHGLSDKSKAEAITAMTKKTIKANYYLDPEFYHRFSDKVEHLIEEIRRAKEEDLKVLLDRAREYQGKVSAYEASDIPEQIREQKKLHPYFRSMKSTLDKHDLAEDKLSEIVKAVHKLIEDNKIIDWHRNIEVERKVRMEIEDYLFDTVKEEFGIPLTVEEIEKVVADAWNLAVENRNLP
mgnify:FL=1